MKTAIVVISIFLAAFAVIIFMQWNTIKKLSVVSEDNSSPNTPTTQDDGAKSLGEMAAAIKKAGGSFKTQIDF